MYSPNWSLPSLQHSFPGNESCVFSLASYELDPDFLCMNNNNTSGPDSYPPLSPHTPHSSWPEHLVWLELDIIDYCGGREGSKTSWLHHCIPKHRKQATSGKVSRNNCHHIWHLEQKQSGLFSAGGDFPTLHLTVYQTQGDFSHQNINPMHI